RCNSELLGKYGNLVNRVLVFAHNRCNGMVPSKGKLEAIDEEFLANIQRLVMEADEAYKNYRLRKATQVIMELAQLGNIYFDNKHQWKDAKDPATQARMQTTIACCLECLNILAMVSSPIIPQTANAVWEMLGFSDIIANLGWDEIASFQIAEGHNLGK